MNQSLRNTMAIILSGMWINASEFFRNEILLKTHWTGHYQSLGLTFPSDLQNGLVWVAWGFSFAVAIFIISRKFDLLQTALMSWLMGFVLMWMVIWNLNVLPTGILIYAVPLSLLEVFIGAFICRKVSPCPIHTPVSPL